MNDRPDDWRVDKEETFEHLREPLPKERRLGKLFFRDGRGRRRRIGEGQLTSEEAAAAARALSYELGAVPLDHARAAALERLAEMRADGAISQEFYDREKRRLLDY